MLPNGIYTHEHNVFDAERQQPDAIIPIFYREKQFNARASKEAGRAIYDEYDAAKFLIPGDNTYEHRDRVNEEHRQRWPRQWAAYQSGMEQVNGMPLDSWYEIIPHPGLIEEMRAMKIKSVEDLANISDQIVTGTMWGLEWRKKAKAEVEKRKSMDAHIAANSELQASLDAEKIKREAMEKQLAEMSAQLSALTAEAPKRGPGRPPKD